MTSFFRLLAVLLLAITLTACGGKKTGDQYPSQVGDSDNVTGTPLPSRDEGVSFLSSNVSKSQFGAVYFEFDSFVVGSAEIPKIRAVADFLSRAPNSLIIAGFTDARGTPEYNRALGEKRAGAVREQLIRMGISPGRIQTVSFGMEMPVDSGSSEAAYAKNRRAEFGVTEVGPFPGARRAVVAMHSFHYQQGTLHCEGADLEALAAAYGTPLYVYSSATIRDHYRRLAGALLGLENLVCYAVKANSNLAILNLLVREGAGFDIVSGGELFRVLKAGGRADQCTFAGVGKTKEEIAYALEAGVHSFNVESEAELAAISEVAARPWHDGALRHSGESRRGGRQPQIHLHRQERKQVRHRHRARLRSVRRRRQARRLARGAACKCTSARRSPSPALSPMAVERMLPLAQKLKSTHGIEFLSIGGGIGIVYQSSLASGENAWWQRRDSSEPSLTLEGYAAAVAPMLRGAGLKILLEPGRLIVGNAGVLLTRVLYRKNSPAKRFVVVDAGMNDLIRPALYGGHHEIVPVREAAPDAPRETVDVVGPVCESGDFFAQDRDLPVTATGDLIALMSAGAYGFAMASNYNSRLLAGRGPGGRGECGGGARPADDGRFDPRRDDSGLVAVRRLIARQRPVGR